MPPVVQEKVASVLVMSETTGFEGLGQVKDDWEYVNVALGRKFLAVAVTELTPELLYPDKEDPVEVMP